MGVMSEPEHLSQAERLHISVGTAQAGENPK
jgi:hypothetical protein